MMRAKVSTKLDLFGNLVSKVDHLVIGGGMANTFLVAQGIEVGKSLAERARALIGLADPEFREGLEREAREKNVIPKGFF